MFCIVFYRISKPIHAKVHLSSGQYAPKLRYHYNCDSNLTEDDSIYKVICYPNPSESK